MVSQLQKRIAQIFKRHFEWTVLAIGLATMAFMDPATQGISLCLLEGLGFEYCPGEGLGHSISYFMRGELLQSFEVHVAGPPATFILGGRIGYLIHRNVNKA